MCDGLFSGWRYRTLNNFNDFSRGLLALNIDVGLSVERIADTLGPIVAWRGYSSQLLSDNGSEFIAQKIQIWLRKNQIKTLYIDPGSPWQNGYIENFHSRFRDECLNREWLLNLREARVVIEDWRQHYNEERPHSKLGYLSPERFLQMKKVSP